MFPIKYNAYIIYLELRYERCKISQILLEEKALVKLLKTIDWGKGICYERIVDKVKSVWIRTQIAFKGTEKGLVERKAVKNKFFNKLTSDGKKL